MQVDVVKKIIASLKCSSCGHSYQEAGIDIIEHRDEVWFLKVLCPVCHVQSMVAAIVRQETGQPAVTDLTAGEFERFQGAAAIGEDDLLKMHAFLTEFDGDLAKLLE